MFTKSLLMPVGFAALAFSGLMFRIAAHAFFAPVTLLSSLTALSRCHGGTLFDCARFISRFAQEGRLPWKTKV